MLHFFGNQDAVVYALSSSKTFTDSDLEKLYWLFDIQAEHNISVFNQENANLPGDYIGPRAAMITPWSTNAVEITQNMGITGIVRIEEFFPAHLYGSEIDPMLFQKYRGLNPSIFHIDLLPKEIQEVADIAAYNQQEGLALSTDEVNYLQDLSIKIGRKLTDSEVFGFSQVNSEHCRHKIFNGTFVIDGVAQESSLFKMIKKTSEANPNEIISAYKDNVAFLAGPTVRQFAPLRSDKADFYIERDFESVISLKAETHNFPTTVEPFNGAATGSGGEIRDRLAGGQGSLPLAGTAVYMTAYSRLEAGRTWEQNMEARPWLYQTPVNILIKASNGASDFGNKFGQPLITGSVLTFEHQEESRKMGFDKVIMLAGGIGYGKKDQAKKITPSVGDKIVVLGGENYRIGMGGAAVSSADTGEFGSGIELNAIQRSNPEMQKRAANAVRGLVEAEHNPIISIHDHGAGGHLNCLSELVEDEGGLIDLDALPVGDPTLSAMEIIGNESQERLGLLIAEKDLELLQNIAERERSPIYKVGEITGSKRFTFASSSTGKKPMDFALEEMFGSSPKMIMEDQAIDRAYLALSYEPDQIEEYVKQVLQLEAVACKDWLTNKVDRCVGGRVAKQQCVGPLQLPLNNVGVMALDYVSKKGIATTVGHSPLTAMIDPAVGSRNAIAESLSNIVFAPLDKGLSSVSLSANWMWPCKNPGEDARLYAAVKACSDFAIELGINIPTGKDSLSMKQKYKDTEVLSPGTVIISAGANCSDVSKVVEPLARVGAGDLYYLAFTESGFELGGSSFAQVLQGIGNVAPDITDAAYFKAVFETVQEAIKAGEISSGHDVGSGGLITTLLEICFADTALGADLDLSVLAESDHAKVLFSEKIALVLQAKPSFENRLKAAGLAINKIGKVTNTPVLNLKNQAQSWALDIAVFRDIWFRTSYLLDRKQSKNNHAELRFQNYKNIGLRYNFPNGFEGIRPKIDKNKPRPKAAIIREKGSNSEREMANAMYMAGFDVKDIHMTDLISGREDLTDIQFIGAVGGFSNSDVLGSAKGWAGAFLYNEKANKALRDFYARPDTLSVGICNGCQLFMELELINPEHEIHGKMKHNGSGKYECRFTSVTIQKNHSVMLSSFEGQTLGIWSAHGEGRFNLPYAEADYHVVAKFGYEQFPANPNGSDFNIAMLADKTGRHLATMPHFERSTFPWNWGYYPAELQHEVSPWIQAFVNAREWIDQQNAK
jgi:phosphoribosylformylglycinamidine synthase